MPPTAHMQQRGWVCCLSWNFIAMQLENVVRWPFPVRFLNLSLSDVIKRTVYFLYYWVSFQKGLRNAVGCSKVKGLLHILYESIGFTWIAVMYNTKMSSQYVLKRLSSSLFHFLDMIKLLNRVNRSVSFITTCLKGYNCKFQRPDENKPHLCSR